MSADKVEDPGLLDWAAGAYLDQQDIRSRVRFVNATIDDAVDIVMDMRPEDHAEVMAQRAPSDFPLRIAEDLVASPCSYTALYDEIPVALIGAVEIRPALCLVYMVATPQWPRVALSVTRFARRVLVPHLLGCGVNRAECRSIESNATAHRWLERLGAVHEGTMADCGPGRETFRLYAWRRGDFNDV